MSLLLLFLGVAAALTVITNWRMQVRWVEPPTTKAPSELVTPLRVAPFEITKL